MNNILTANVVELIDAHEMPPAVGSCVLVLTIGGVLTKTEWKSDSLKYFDAYCEHPKIPESVKKRQLARYSVQDGAPKGEV